MQAEASGLCTIDDFDATLIPVEILPCDVSRGRPSDPQSIVELGKQLLECAKIGDTDMVRDLMCRGAPFTTDWLGTSALHHAAQNNHLETAEVLLRAGISRDARTKVDRTPLHMAAYEGHDQMAQLLLNYGAEVDSRDMLKMTPLHWAVEQEHIEVMLILLENGANPHAISKFNRTPLTLALEHERLDFVELLQQEREIVGTENEELQSNEMDAATQNLMQLEAERQREEQERIELEQQQEKQRAKQQTANANKKQRMMYHRVVHPIVQTTYDEAEQERDELQRLEEKTIYLENSRSKQAFANLTEIQQPNIQQFLKENGLTVIPVDDESTMVENAVGSGHHVVLTEAGQLALNLTKTKPINRPPIKRLQLNPKKVNSKKVFTIRADQILTQHTPQQSTSRGPNILKRSSNNNEIKQAGKLILTPIVTMTTACPTYNLTTKSTTTTSTSKSKKSNAVLPKTESVILRLQEQADDIFEISSEEEQISDINELNRQLTEARKEIEEYKKKLKKKEEEADLYKQQLQILIGQRTLK